jgi:glycerol-3-phosphate dehydrogenase
VPAGAARWSVHSTGKNIRDPKCETLPAKSKRNAWWLMRRDEMLRRAKDGANFDLIVIGGGATGVGIAVDAASRGYSILLLERGDFGCGTSSRSTKLIHGGVRYLRQGNVSLVMEGLRERGLLQRNAPHLVHAMPFVVPVSGSWEKLFYGAGLKIYDIMAGRYGFGKSKLLSKKAAMKRVPTLSENARAGGVLYFDGQFDDARLLIDLTHTAAREGAVVLNYAPVTRLNRNAHGHVIGVDFTDAETTTTHSATARCVVNATGAFSDSVRRMDDAKASPRIAASQGIHVVLSRDFLPGNTAIMVPKTPDGRVIFAIPWREHTLIGTTDTAIPNASAEPVARPDEIDFLLSTVGKYLQHPPTRADVLSVFAGIRPLVKEAGKPTKRLARDHLIDVSPSKLISVVGGKWTTYRQMAEEVVHRAATVGGLDHRECVTRQLKIFGGEAAPTSGNFAIYGTAAKMIQDLIAANPSLATRLHPQLPIVAAEVIHAVRSEMARKPEDVLARRTRALFLNAKAALEMAEQTAQLIARELHQDETWINQQLTDFRQLASNYIVPPA